MSAEASPLYLIKLRKLAAKGNLAAKKKLAQLFAKKGKSAKPVSGKSAPPFKGKRDLSISTDNANVEVVDLAVAPKGNSPTRRATYAERSGVGTGFDENKHNRSPNNGQWARKITPSELIAARRTIEGGVTNLQVGQTFTLPDKLGWVKRTEGGYFIQGPSGFSASVRSLSSAIQAAASILAGNAKAPVKGKVK